MRRRSRLALPVAALAACATLAAAPSASGAPAPDVPAQDVPAQAHHTARAVGSASGAVQLVTGQRVRLVHSGAAVVAEVDHVGSGSRRALATRTVNGRTSVVPLVAQPYLQRFLDPGLFDVDTLARSTGKDGHIAVRVSYRGSARPSVPGVHLTSAADGTADGYLTPSSAGTFGKALAAQFAKDRKAGWPRRTSVFGVTRISAAATTPVATPQFPMLTLIVRATGSDGKPAPFAFVGLVNVDDARKYGTFAVLSDGEARVSVPAGHYGLISDEYDGRYERIVTVNEVAVTRSGQVVAVDFRTATKKSSVSTPKPASSTGYNFEWDRTDARGAGGLSSGYGMDSPADVRVAPSPKPAIGSAEVVQSFTLAQRGARKPAYTYDLAAADDGIPSALGKHFATADLGVVGAVYYGDGATREGAFGRAALYSSSGFVVIALTAVDRPTSRTEYVGSLGTERPVWAEAGIVNDASYDDPGFVDGAPHAVPALSYRDARWFRGPFAPAVPIQTTYAACWNCRTGNTVTLGMPTFIDGDPTHVGEFFGAADGIPVARFRLYRGDTLLTDQDDVNGATLDVPAAAATYRAVLDVDRRLTDPVTSTLTHTEWTFRSAEGAGPAAPKGWYCDSGQVDCRALPVVQARVKLPTNLEGRLPDGRSTIVVLAGQAQGSPTSPVTSATLELRGQGYDWQSVPLTSTGDGRYTAVVDNSDYAGTYVDVRVATTDQAGSTFRQTTLRAYRVAS